MKQFFKYILIATVFLIYSCSSKEENPEELSVATAIEGTWYKEGNLTSTKLIFKGNTFEIAATTATISGIFKLEEDNTFIGTFKAIHGDTKAILTPVNFTGTYELSGKKLSFSNFNGSWSEVFNTYYEK